MKAKRIWRAAAGVGILTLLIFAAPPTTNAKPRNDPYAPAFELKPTDFDAVREVDRLVAEHLQSRSLQPTGVCDDSAFLRRVTLDLIGRIPTTVEYERFIHDAPPNRRQTVVRRLLTDERFDARWAAFFGDTMRIRGNTREGRSLHHFVMRSLRANRPYDEMVTEMLTAVGRSTDAPAGGFILSADADPLQMAAMVSHAFLGVRMQCAQCHDHPFDIWTREDYYALAAYFGRTGMHRKSNNSPGMIVRQTHERVMWPPTRKPGVPQRPVEPEWPFDLAEAGELSYRVPAKVGPDDAVEDLIVEGLAAAGAGPTDELSRERRRLEEEAAEIDMAPERRTLADVLVNPRNGLFAGSLVNRVWAELNGIGIVMPVDDFRDDNEPTNPALLDHLAERFVVGGYDLRQLIETIVLSDTYQRRPLRGVGERDRMELEQAFGARPIRRMHAEMLYDSLIVAGRLNSYKDLRGSRDRQRTIRQRYIKDVIDLAELADEPSDMDLDTAAEAEASANLARAYDPFEAEGGINFDAVLESANDPLAGMRLMGETLENAEKIAAAVDPETGDVAEGKQIVYGYREVEITYDARVRFTSAYRRPGPGRSDSFLRVFGQPPRQLLGEKRTGMANMRQALILLNGRLANEAARIGNLEPLWQLTEAGMPIEPVIRRVYVASLTRQPTPREIAGARELIEQSPDVRSGVQDLRWALVNSHEFRYLP